MRKSYGVTRHRYVRRLGGEHIRFRGNTATEIRVPNIPKGWGDKNWLHPRIASESVPR